MSCARGAWDAVLGLDPSGMLTPEAELTCAPPNSALTGGESSPYLALSSPDLTIEEFPSHVAD